MNRVTRVRALVPATTIAAVLAMGAVGCGEEGGGATVEAATLIHGTTDRPVSYDPAGSYDLPSWNIIYNTYQTLLTIPVGGNQPEPDAAEDCDFKDDKTYECTLKRGLTFSDGSELTSEDVKFSFDRNLKIADPQGASSLFANLQDVETPDDRTVVFNLKAADATWPFLLTTASAAIVPSDIYSPTKIQDSAEVVGSGPYTVADYQEGRQTALEVNPEYTGPNRPATERVIVQQFDKSSALKLALEQAEVDIAYRNLSPTEIEDLEGQEDEGIQVVQGQGIEVRYLVFNLNLQAGESDAQKLAVRRAAAYTIDRQSIAANVYNGTVEPLYSMVPQGLEFATEPFRDEYGESPDPQAAEQELKEAGLETPVKTDVWYTPSHYGPASADEYAEIQRQLEGNGLFEVELKSTEWNQYSEAALKDKYPIYQLGWLPDFPDADNYLSSFYSKDSFLNSHYEEPEIEKLLAEEKTTTDREKRGAALEEIQRIVAEDAPTIPYSQANQVAGIQDGVEGVEETLDPSSIFRYYLISKEG
jgi:peptide/nickel transport system substrate-binding protein